ALERQAVALATQLEEELAAAGNGVADATSSGTVTDPAPTPVDGFGLPVALTPRELEILDCLVDGLSNAAIGRVLHISPNTAANHVRAILLKTGCANRTEVAAWAVRRGVVAR